MELVEYKMNRRSDIFPGISVGKKGTMRFNRSAVNELELKPGQKVMFAQDKNEPLDWYFKIGNEGVTMRETTSKDGSLIFNFSIVARAILGTIKTESTTLIRIATKASENGYHAILTRSV